MSEYAKTFRELDVYQQTFAGVMKIYRIVPGANLAHKEIAARRDNL